MFGRSPVGAWPRCVPRTSQVDIDLCVIHWKDVRNLRKSKLTDELDACGWLVMVSGWVCGLEEYCWRTECRGMVPITTLSGTVRLNGVSATSTTNWNKPNSLVNLQRIYKLEILFIKNWCHSSGTTIFSMSDHAYEYSLDLYKGQHIININISCDCLTLSRLSN